MTPTPPQAGERAEASLDGRRIDWLMDNCAVVKTDGAGNWFVVLEWTNPETQFSNAPAKRWAIDTAMAELAALDSEESK